MFKIISVMVVVCNCVGAWVIPMGMGEWSNAANSLTKQIIGALGDFVWKHVSKQTRASLLFDKKKIWIHTSLCEDCLDFADTYFENKNKKLSYFANTLKI